MGDVPSGFMPSLLSPISLTDERRNRATREGMMDRWMDDGQIDKFKFKILKGLVLATVLQVSSKLRQVAQEDYILTLSFSLSSEQ